MNNDFHNISKFFAQFDMSFCRNLNFLTKRVWERLTLFPCLEDYHSLFSLHEKLKRRIFTANLPKEKSPFDSYCSKY